MSIQIDALADLPELQPGDDLAALLAAAAELLDGGLRDDDIVVIAQKAVSKVEGRLVELADVRPGPRALGLAEEHGKDARLVQVVLDESAEVLRADRGRLICRTHHGFVCANAGVDASNTGAPDRLVLLPVDPDRSARGLRAALRDLAGVSPAIVISDSFGRPWRIGQSEVAIGCAGLAVLDDWRGRRDRDGRELAATVAGIADEVAAAADLARGKDSGQPAIRIRGLGRHVLAEDGPGTRALIRPPEGDLFR